MFDTSNTFCHKDISNCEVFEPYNKLQELVFCKTCKKGYFLTSQTSCNEVTFAPFCTNYNLATGTCIECLSDYYLYDHKCYYIQKINYCLNHTFDGQIFKCTLCSTLTYLDTNGKCSLRQFFLDDIEFCEELSVNADKCASCINTKILNFNGQKCFENIENCSELEPVIESTEYLKCKTCDDQFISSPNKTNCYLPIDNCISYDHQFVECLECDSSSFYLESPQKCQLRSNIDSNCQTYSIHSDICSECISSHFQLTDDKQKCLEKISDCDVSC